MLFLNKIEASITLLKYKAYEYHLTKNIRKELSVFWKVKEV